jgi:hypothetical protein
VNTLERTSRSSQRAAATTSRTHKVQGTRPATVSIKCLSIRSNEFGTSDSSDCDTALAHGLGWRGRERILEFAPNAVGIKSTAAISSGKKCVQQLAAPTTTCELAVFQRKPWRTCQACMSGESAPALAPVQAKQNQCITCTAAWHSYGPSH